MQKDITPARQVDGSVILPGDKSISHRYAMLAAVAEGRTRIANFSTGADCQSTLGCIRALGVQVNHEDGHVIIEGRGPAGLQAPAQTLDAGNSGSTIRMLSGILAGQPFESQISGDESLARRPMDRIIKPLAEMGARISAREGRYPPLTITGGKLQTIEYSLPMASAQVKTCVLFGGMFADGVTTVHQPVRTRDHGEAALREFGADVQVNRLAISLRGPSRLTGREVTVPGDLSSAAFFLVAALLLPGSALTIQGVGLNPTRTALLDFLAGGGAQIKVLEVVQHAGEISGNLLVRHSRFKGGVLDGARTAALIDEIPVLAVLGAVSENGLTVRDAAELRIKETDRIATIAENLGRMGVKIEVTPDGFLVPGKQRFRAAQLHSFGDHRIAMAFAVAALAADGPSIVENAEAASVSFPEFYDTLARIAS